MKNCNRCKVNKPIKEFIKSNKEFKVCNRCRDTTKMSKKERKAGFKAPLNILNTKREVALSRGNYFCPSCNKELHIDKFSKNANSTVHGFSYNCNSCTYKKQRIRKLKSKYNLNTEEIDFILSKEIHNCTICNKFITLKNDCENRNNSLTIDHDHFTNKFRNILCMSCNRALGLFQDNPDIILKAYNYLKLHKNE